MKNKILFTLFLLFIVSCTSEQGNSSLEKYVSYNTTGMIGVKMPIIIDLIDSMKINEANLNSSISMTPNVAFTAERVGETGIKITPKTNFDYDTKYKISVDLNKLSGVQEKGSHTFEIYTSTPSYSYYDNDLSLYSLDRDNIYYLSGIVNSSDYIDSLFVEKNSKIEGGENLKATWTHSADGMTHQYRIDSIRSKEKEYTISTIRNHAQENSYTATVPQKGDYRVMGYEVMYEPLRLIVTFSTAIEGNQRFSDLVSLGDNKLSFTTSLNKLSIYPAARLIGGYVLEIKDALKNNNGVTLKENYTKTITINDVTPSIQLIGKGNIMPSANDMTILFQSINYAKAQVRIKRIYQNNILQFFQSNNYDGDNLYMVARVIADTTIILGDKRSDKLKHINNYGLKLTDLVKPEPGAIYRLEIMGKEPLIESEGDDYYYDYYFGDYKTYSVRSRNILVSDLGIIAKANDANHFTLFVTNLLTAKPVSGAKITLYNNVNQVVGEVVTEGDGKASINTKEEPSLLIASHGGQSSYLKVEKGLSLSLSNFDVSGNAAPSGIKGYIFGERGVWRPGDELFITFMTMYDKESIPANHPATLEFRNPQGQIITKLSATNSSDGIYCFKLKTDSQAPTGNWEVAINFGGEVFKKNIKIETIKPNRLKILLELNDKPAIPAKSVEAKLNVQWLHGAIAKDLATKIDVELSKTKTTFKGYDDYLFDDQTKRFDTEEKELFKSKTNQEGSAISKGAISGLEGNSPGLLNAKFTVKVFEQSGDFSIDQYITKISPYDTYVGLYVKEQNNSWGKEYLDVNKTHDVNIVAIDLNGKLQNKKEVKVEIYKMEWSWWWNSSSENGLASYAQNSYNRPFKTSYVKLNNGKGVMPLTWSENDWGLYLIRVTDTEGGHSATKVCYVDSGYGHEVDGSTSAATRLTITKDKKSYNVGETVNLSIPSAKGAKALVTLETGNKILKSMWVECSADKTTIAIVLDETMTPNIYANVMMIQPHSTTLNDAPIRMYGVERINVEDKKTRLKPVIEIAEQVRPESNITFKVKEANGEAMSYVVAIVDEGLLDLTRYKTPDAWAYFYANEALGIRTWDLYDLVMGAYGGRIEQLFAIGGDDELVGAGKIKAERFKPVVQFIPANKLEKGKTASHTIQLPPYIGAVKVMVIASSGRAKGSADKSVKVRKPMMIQTTLPRVMGVSEEIVIPVTVFAMQDNIGTIDVELKQGKEFTIIGDSKKSVSLSKSGEQMVYFKIKTSDKECMTTIIVDAKSSDDKSSNKTQIEISNSNPRTYDSQSLLLKANETQKVNYSLIGMKGTNEAKIELSTIPAMNLSARLKYLVAYPHGCIEQITSGAFAQLYLGDISNQKVDKCEENVKATLNMLNRYQLSNGGFAYWSGGRDVSQWGTIYAGHFMNEAIKKGYSVNSELKSKWLSYMTKSVNNNTFVNPEVQSYALYVLSLAGEPQRGAMNRMRERKDRSAQSLWFLAGAYAKDNKRDIAQTIIANISSVVPQGDHFGETFYSSERDEAVILSVLNMLGEREKAFKMVQKLAESLNDNKIWLSTQSAAWMIHSISSYITANKQSDINAVIRVGGKEYNVNTPKTIAEIALNLEGVDKTLPVVIENKNGALLYAVISSNGIPAIGQERAKANGLRLDVSYNDMSGNVLNPMDLKAGTDFITTIKVTNIGTTNYTNVALNYLVPSGWEIQNKRVNSTSNDYPQGLSYQDIRDDRVYSYFDLKRSGSVTVKIGQTATYKGEFYLPSITTEAMYDGTVNAMTLGGWCKVR